MWTRFFSGASALAILFAAAIPATAQTSRDSVRTTRQPRCPLDYDECTAVGAGVGTVALVTAGEGVPLVPSILVGLQLTRLRSAGGTIDFGLYTRPVVSDTVFVVPQVSLAFTKPIGSSWLIAKIGFWGAFVVEPEGVGELLGVQAGVGLLARISPSAALRIEIGPHVPLAGQTEGSSPALMISLGIASLQSR
jgi:hypothetical protein